MKCKECKYRLVDYRDIAVCYKTSYQLLDSMETHPKCPFLNKKEDWIVELTECDYEIWGSDIDCGSREKAIEKGIEAAKKDGLTSFRIGKKEPCAMATIDADTIIENAQEQLYDEVGEVSETYLEGVTEEQENELEEELNKVT